MSWLRHRNPIPQVLGMDDKIYTKDPRFSVIHNPEDPKLKEVSQNKETHDVLIGMIFCITLALMQYRTLHC